MEAEATRRPGKKWKLVGALAVAWVSAGSAAATEPTCPLLKAVPLHDLNCRGIPIDGARRGSLPEGTVTVAVTISDDGTLLSSRVLRADPADLGPRAIRSLKRACWELHQVDGAPSCYRSEIELVFKVTSTDAR